MMRVLSLTKTLMRILLRDKISLFWLVAFPLVLMTFLNLIFSSFDNPENVSFKVVLLRNPGKNVEIVEKALESVSSSKKNEKNIINLKVQGLGQSETALRHEIEKLKEQKIHALVVVPTAFDKEFDNWIRSAMGRAPAKQPELKVYFLKERASSKISAEIVRSVVRHINNSFAVVAKVPLKDYQVKQEYVGTTKRMRYRDFLFPSMIIFSFFATSLFGIAEEVVQFRSKGILKRLHLTTISSSELFFSFNLSRVLLMLMQFALVSAVGVWIFRININPFHRAVLSYSGLSAVTFMSVAFMLASVISNTQQATVVTQLVMQVFQFLGGLYFNVFSIPLFLRWIVYVNPLTYLVSGMRQNLGVVDAPYPYYLSYTVPLIWIGASVLIAVRYFRWVEEK